MRVRHLYFSEKLADPNDPTSAVEFYLTVEGQTPKMFDMNCDQSRTSWRSRERSRTGSLKTDPANCTPSTFISCIFCCSITWAGR